MIEPRAHRSTFKSWFLYSPGWVALIASVSFLLLSAVYLVLSTTSATEAFDSVRDFGRFELIKGLVFMAFTAVLIGVIILLLLRMVRRRENALAAHRQSLLQVERRALTSLFAASVAHDSNNLLCVARTQLELSLASQSLPSSEAERIDRVVKMLSDLVEINRRLVDSSRRSNHRPGQPFDLNRHVCRALNFASLNRFVRHCHLETELQGGLNVSGDPLLFEQAVINLVFNAAEASTPKSTILVRTASENGSAVVEIHDSGEGVPQNLRSRIFEPFFTQKSDGAGLGLVTVRAFADTHGAQLVVLDSPLGGACFRISIPIRSE